MSHYKPYPAYKDSGVEWIGRVPEHWEVKRFKFAISTCRNGIWGDDPTGHDDTPCVRVADFDRSGLRVNQEIPTLRAIPERDRASRLLRPGNLLLEKSGGGDSQPVGQVVLYDQAVEAVCSNFIARMELVHRADPSFWCYQFAGAYACGLNLRSVKQTSGIQNLDQEQYLDEMATCPPHAEQSAIAAALDRETARIDALIAKKTRFIELLKEKRQALITHAVTKGLDPNVKMKDSGVEWIGEVPEHWTLMKFGRVARVTEGLVDPRLEPYRAMPLFAPNHIESSTGRLLAVESAAEQYAESGKYLCKAGCVVYSKIRPALSKVIIAPTDGLCSADMYPLTCTEKAEAQWLFYLMLSQAFTAWAVLESDRVAMPKINRESLADLVVAVPPTAEQQKIASAIEARLPRVDTVIEKVNASITLLKERRSALITAAVTGQIDLREEAL